jgi:hypothetical protein
MTPFQGCWERIERAEFHQHEMAETWNDLEDDAYTVSADMKDDGTGSIRVTPRDGVLPANVGLQFGELLYQLRAALDGCIFAAAILDSGKNPPPKERRLEFPICTRRDEFKNSDSKIFPLSDKRKAIIEAVQPYNTPALSPELFIGNVNRSLGFLNDWARKDRHRKLHPVGSWPSKAIPKLRIPPGTTIDYLTPTKTGILLEHEDEVAVFKLTGWVRGMKLSANPDVSIDIWLNESPPSAAENDTFSNRVESMIIATRFVIDAIETSKELKFAG